MRRIFRRQVCGNRTKTTALKICLKKTNKKSPLAEFLGGFLKIILRTCLLSLILDVRSAEKFRRVFLQKRAKT